MARDAARQTATPCQPEGVNDAYFDPSAILSSIGEIAYAWDIGADSLRWAGDPTRVIPADAATLLSGKGYESLMAGDPSRGRAAAIAGSGALDAGSGVRFDLNYRLRIADDLFVAVEDRGRWFAGPDGRPSLAQGVIRVTREREEPSGRMAERLPLDEATGAVLASGLEHLIAGAVATRTPCALILIAFSAPRDVARDPETLDRAMAGCAARLRRVMRRRDTLVRPSHDRLGVFLQACDLPQLRVAAQRFETALTAPEPTSSAHPRLTPRLGGAVCAADGRALEPLVAAAERALEESVGAGATRLVLARGASPGERRAVDWSHEAVRALNERRIMIALQPVVRAGDRRVAFHEALLRIHEPGGALVAASGFMPAIEKAGLAPLIDLRALELTLSAMERDRALIASLNVSAATLATRDWIDAASAHLERRPDLARRLIVEITETALVEDLPEVSKMFERLRALGARTAIDDFGAGHSSFKVLRGLPIDIVKIDGLFVQGLDNRSDDRFFVRTLADLGRRLRMSTVAEWVETEAVARIVEGLGIDYLQGDLFGAAAPPSEAGPVACPAVA